MGEKYWKLGIVGWPLGYSLSPLMHNAALKAMDQKGHYLEYKLRPDSRGPDSGEMFGGLIEPILHKEKLDGFNVTMPYKKGAYNWVHHAHGHGRLEESSGLLGESIRVINTVKMEGDVPVGHNTDGEGFLLPLTERGLDLSDWHVILLGAGGAAQTLAAMMAYRTKAKRLTVWNRTPESAAILCYGLNASLRFHQDRGAFSYAAESLDDLPIEDTQLVVNATPMGMAKEGEVPQEVRGRLHSEQLVYDIVYEPRETAFIRAALDKGCKVITGDEMLAGQGAAAFEIWTGMPAANVLPVMKKALDEHFAGRG